MIDNVPSQFSIFKDCIARKMLHSQVTQSQDSDPDSESALDEFSTYLAAEAWTTLPLPIKTASYANREELSKSIPDIKDLDSESLNLDSISPGFTDTLVSYRLVSDEEDATRFLRNAIIDFVEQATAPPPAWSSTRTNECEICEREVPLTYHHLIPRSTHDKVLKKGWHSESMINSVAWLCRPCHSAVHHVASTEELARSFYTIELLLQRGDIQRWQKYAAKQRWGVRRG